MKIAIKQIGAAVTLPTGVISFPWKDEKGATHTVELHSDAQVQLMMPLLATTPVQSGASSPRVFHPMGVQASRLSSGNTGIQLFLSEQIAIHISLHPAVLAALKAKLETLEKTDQAKH